MSESGVFNRLNQITSLFLDKSRRDKTFATYQISYKGFKIHLNYPGNRYMPDSDLNDFLIIAYVANENYRGKGWFWRYIAFCRTVVKDGVVIECVGNESLYQSLKKKKEFVEFNGRSFWTSEIIKKDIRYTAN